MKKPMCMSTLVDKGRQRMQVVPAIPHTRCSLPWRTSLVLLVSFCVCAEVVFADEPPFEPGKASQDTAATLEKYHVTHRPLDDDLSGEWFAAFLERLDPRKMYFVASDLAIFQPFEGRLDDLAKSADFQFAELVRAAYRQRAGDAGEMAREILQKLPDLTVAEDMPLRYEEFASDRSELRERWRKRIKHELVIEKLHGVPIAAVQEQLLDRYARIARQARDMSDERLCAVYLQALASRYDPDAYFLSPTLLASFSTSPTFTTYSLGLGVRQHRGQYLIERVTPGIGGQRFSDLFGWELLAIRRLGRTFDIVEMHPDDLYELISFDFGRMGDDPAVTLELIHPETLERNSIEWALIENE